MYCGVCARTAACVANLQADGLHAAAAGGADAQTCTSLHNYCPELQRTQIMGEMRCLSWKRGSRPKTHGGRELSRHLHSKT